MPNSIQIRGLTEANATFRQMPETFRDALNAATELTVREIVRNAQSRIQASPSVRTRSLLNHITFAMDTKSGRGRAGVSDGTMRIGGVRVRRIIDPSRYAHFVEFGTVHMPAEPFMIPAAEGQKAQHISRCMAAGKKAEQHLATIGSRHP